MALITAKQQLEFQEVQENAKQIQTVDERFEAAKRKTEEYGMRPGIIPNRRRREIVEKLVRQVESKKGFCTLE